jgi:hypothetical protein
MRRKRNFAILDLHKIIKLAQFGIKISDSTTQFRPAIQLKWVAHCTVHTHSTDQIRGQLNSTIRAGAIRARKNNQTY